MKTVFKIGFILVAALGYVAWTLWCYNEFGADFTPACLATWAFMVACKLVVGVILFGFWDLSFNDDYGVPISRNPPMPPPRKHNDIIVR